MAPYPPQAFHYSARHVGPTQTPPPNLGAGSTPMPHPGMDSVHAIPRVPTPYGLISDLPLPVPTGESQVNRNIAHTRVWL